MVLRKIVEVIQSADFWALMSDETTDITVKVIFPSGVWREKIFLEHGERKK